MTLKHIPDGYHSVTPYLVVDGAAELITFLEKAFSAQEVQERMVVGNRIMHAELQIGDSKIMVSDAQKEYPAHPSILYLYVESVDKVYKQALEAGARSISEPQDMFYGDRHGGVIDPSGNKWWIATRKENLTPDQMKQREQEFVKNMAVGAKS